ncbi:MAG: hypothetical protein HZA46_18880 [Planctomycetales bacterium]|nr:hypothetical protein [Planctomycetales bacterium]
MSAYFTISAVCLVSVVAVIGGFVVSLVMSRSLSGDDRKTAANCCSLFARAIKLGAFLALMGVFLVFNRPFGMMGQPPSHEVELGWIGGVILVFLREAVRLWNRWWNPGAAGRDEVRLFWGGFGFLHR